MKIHEIKNIFQLIAIKRIKKMIKSEMFLNDFYVESLEDRYVKKEGRNQMTSLVRKALRKLNPKHALIVRLRYWKGFSHKKTAKIIKSTPGSVATTLVYIRKKLKSLIIKEAENVPLETLTDL